MRLNRRLAPAIYLDVVAITGSVDRPAIGGDGPVVEYAVKMREFPQEALASRMLAAARSAQATSTRWPRRSPPSTAASTPPGAGTRFGSPDTILRVALQNFDQIRPLLDDPDDRARLDALRAWTEREHAARLAAFGRRKADGFVRECHGDLHLNNIARHRRRGHDLRLHRIQRRAALDRRDERNRVHDDGPRRIAGGRTSRTGSSTRISSSPATTRDSRCCPSTSSTGRWCGRRSRACGSGQLPAGDERTALVAEYRGYVDLASPLRAAAASGDRHHARPVRLRQDHADAGIARMDRRDPDPHRRRAQAAARP